MSRPSTRSSIISAALMSCPQPRMQPSSPPPTRCPGIATPRPPRRRRIRVLRCRILETATAGERAAHARTRGRRSGSALLGLELLRLHNFFDGVALWSDQLVGGRVERGVNVLICQSGTIAPQPPFRDRSHARRGANGGQSGRGSPQRIYWTSLVEDERVTAFGLYLEGIRGTSPASRRRPHAPAQPASRLLHSRPAAPPRVAETVHTPHRGPGWRRRSLRCSSASRPECRCESRSRPQVRR